MNTAHYEEFESLVSHRGALIDIDDIEIDLGLGRGTVRSWISRGVCPIPFLRFRGRVKVRKTALIDWLIDQEIDQTAQRPESVNTASAAARKGRPPKVRDLAREAAQYGR